MSLKVMITGSCGFIYSNVVLYALQHTDWDIVSVDKLTYAGSLANIAYNRDINNKRHKFYLADIADYHLMEKIFDIEKPDIVINGAANSHVDNSIAGSQDFIQSNVTGTHSLLEAMRKSHRPQKFIQASTDEVYGQIESGSFSETDSLSPRNPYSSSKASADLMCNAYIETYDLPIIITRCCNVFGSRQNKEKMIPKSIINLLNDDKIKVYGKGEQVREWIYTKDMFYAIKTIIESGKVKEVYNIGTGYELRNIDLAYKIADHIGVPHKDAVEFVTDRLGHDFRYSVNTSKIRALGWSPMYSFDEALLHTISWYYKNTWSWR